MAKAKKKKKTVARRRNPSPQKKALTEREIAERRLIVGDLVGDTKRRQLDQLRNGAAFQRAPGTGSSQYFTGRPPPIQGNVGGY